MFDDVGLAVSLPARELGPVVLPGSLFEAGQLADAPVSPELALALRLVAEACARRGSRLVCLARPEIFVGPAAQAWLAERLGGIANHLCLSDGATIRVVAGLHNHVFLYRPGLRASAEAFRQLARRAPELLAGMASQVNTAFRVPLGAGARPPSLLLLPAAADPPAPGGGLLACYFTPGGAEHCANWIVAKGAVSADALAGFARATYLPLTEAALAERAFCETLVGLVARACFDPAACLLLRLPVLDSPAASLADRLAAALAGFARGRGQLPQVPPRNVFFLAGDLDAAVPQGLAMPVALVMPESFDFWRHPAAFYARFAAATVLAAAARRHEQAGLAALLGRALGRKPELRWLTPEIPEPA
jgi:hypothetical protein